MGTTAKINTSSERKDNPRMKTNSNMKMNPKMQPYEYERQGPAPRTFFGQNHNYSLIFGASPMCEGWHGFLQNQGNLDR